jgi:hypothetical protein
MIAICEQCELGSVRAVLLSVRRDEKADLGVAAAAVTADGNGDVHFYFANLHLIRWTLLVHNGSHRPTPPEDTSAVWVD